MVTWHRKSLLTRIERAEIQSQRKKNKGILIIDMDKNGLYGEQGLTEEELEQYIQKNGYEVVIIDDISLMGE